ncbi:MAG: DUF6371 domain-containing protein [Flavipsychrobacter sp.]
MKTYRYTLQPYKGRNTRYTCPQCGCKDVFVRYIDTTTGEHLAEDVGRCNREQQCGYHMPPKSGNTKCQFLNTKKQILNPKNQPSTNQPVNQSTSQLKAIFKNSLCCYPQNGLAQYIYHTYGWQAMERVLDAYRIGSHTDGSTIFWQIDAQQRIRSGKLIQYDAQTGHRIKGTDTPPVRWVHSLHKLQGFTLHQCFFGEHLLKGNRRLPIAIVESEKTAAIASIRMPQYLWLATGGIRNLSAEKCSVLEGRQIILFPDAGAWDYWHSIATQIRKCSISHVLQHHTDGSDIADYL